MQRAAREIHCPVQEGNYGGSCAGISVLRGWGPSDPVHSAFQRSDRFIQRGSQVLDSLIFLLGKCKDKLQNTQMGVINPKSHPLVVFGGPHKFSEEQLKA